MPTTVNGKALKAAPSFDAAFPPSDKLKPELPAGTRLHYLPRGADREILLKERASPYSGGTNLVSVGSMLFDPTFFEIASKMFPKIVFCIIGGGKNASKLHASNIKVYDEMPFESTLSFMLYAYGGGIAPYRAEKVATYLADTSLKILQYEILGLPAICQHEVVGDRPMRYGYNTKDVESIVNAIRAAIESNRFTPRDVVSWRQVAEQLLRMENHFI